ncbi:MAG: biopolymer transporter ExbD [Gemmatimonadaceae bacterium]|nr:biopolymer transporter ExbD [Gemmatimonadaceae bacterium]
MARRGRGERTPLNAEINVVSLIDVMMLLMIIFMITAPMMTGGVDVALPKAVSRPLDTKSPLVVSITRTGQIYVDDVSVSLAEFRGSLRSLAAKSGTDAVALRADQGVDYGKVVQVLAVMQAAGVKVNLLTEPEDVNK